METKLKICKYCTEEKVEELFVPNGTSKRTGETLRKNICKKCRNKKRDLARKNNKSEARKLSDIKRWNKANSGDKGKNKKLKLNYGICLEDFNTMLMEQNYLCKICKNKMNKPCVDHSHSTGKVRGLLCSECNTALGLFKENVDILEEAILYVKNNN